MWNHRVSCAALAAIVSIAALTSCGESNLSNDETPQDALTNDARSAPRTDARPDRDARPRPDAGSILLFDVGREPLDGRIRPDAAADSDRGPTDDARSSDARSPGDAHAADLAGQSDGRVPTDSGPVDGPPSMDALATDGRPPGDGQVQFDVQPPPDARDPGLDARAPAPDGPVGPDPDARLPTPDAFTPTPDAREATPDAAPVPDAAPIPDPDAFVAHGPLAPRVPNATCRFPDVPPLGALQTVEAFPALDFTSPLWLGHAGDGSGWLYVLEQGGVIYTFENRDNVVDRTEFMRVDTVVNGETGLLGLAFHPNYVENGLFYVFYSVANPLRSRISEFRRSANNTHTGDAATERVLLEVAKPFSNHNGGDMHFGPDGMLYIALGDGGSGGDPRNHGQDVTTLLGSMLRLDVDHRDAGLPYAIPPDNPFAECAPNCGPNGAARPEIWAWGLRNPWRFSFDRTTGVLWAGDVGQGAWEEIDHIRGGENYGWNVWEGAHCYNADDCDPTGMTMPVHEYGRADGESIIGGWVYRGGDFPELWGAYVYGDNHNGKIWAIREAGGAATEVALLVDTSIQLTSFGVDEANRLYLVGFNAGRSLWRLSRRANLPVPVLPPARLSQTGCFDDVAAHTLAPGVVPYDVNSPLWSDGAGKLRAIALPDGETFTYREGQSWDAPQGTVALKTFTLPAPGGGARRVETRVLTRQSEGWQGYTYRWNDAQDEADLLPGTLTEAIATADGPQSWTYPSRAQCDACHTEAAGHLLGLTTAQLNGELDYTGGGANALPVNQLAALSGAGYVELPAPPEALPALARPDNVAAPLEARARAWLATNCSQCHRPGANGNTRFDVRAETPLADTLLCDAVPGQGDVGLLNARLIAPGAPERSVLHARIAGRGPEQMPPLATTRVDPLGDDVIRRYIQGLQGCPP